mmetsp:Transcript_6159/g.10512  ORF Transcript_6159/g.10512 Transcript_6159/m.10512 type:complete len:275 (-) Transcript_6159:453-1277(-)
MKRSEDERLLDEEHARVKEARDVRGGRFHGMVPQCVDRRPREGVAVVLSNEVDRAGGEAPGPTSAAAPGRGGVVPRRPAQKQSSVLVLHDQYDDEQYDHGRLGARLGHVLGRGVVRHVSLDQVQDVEDAVHDERRYVIPAQIGVILCIIFVKELSLVDESPNDALVNQVQAPHQRPRRRRRLRDRTRQRVRLLGRIELSLLAVLVRPARTVLPVVPHARRGLEVSAGNRLVDFVVLDVRVRFRPESRRVLDGLKLERPVEAEGDVPAARDAGDE